MKPVYIMEDIVRPKPVAKSNGAKFVKTVLKLSGVKIPFFIWFVIILAETVGMVRIAKVSQPDVAMDVPQAAIMVQNVAAPLASISTSSTSTVISTSTTATTSFGSLPVVQVPPFKATSTATSSRKTATQPSQPKSAQIPTAVTARSLLDATTLSVSEEHDGPYKVTFVTDAGTYGKIPWSLDDATLTVSESMPSFSVSFSCNPLPNTPNPSAPDQNPTFDVRASYTCTIDFTPTSGSDHRTQSKQFSFATGAGQLIITPPSSMNTMLNNNANFGGFIFRNDDTQPITITGLDIDVSYRGLNIINTPLVLRVENPATGVSLVDYHLEKLAADPSSSYAYAGTDIHIPLSFTLGATSQKMLPVDILGVQRLSIYGINPTIAVTLRGVTTNQNMNKIVLSSPKISWSCIVPLGAYDPNATSGPYATGQACQ